ncbi:hypothetical protein ACR77J_14055 [Tissierella praeacuta]|uniref:hypothetical protein n=1 Tax=Tissierella praeacuta TaxID=43131 RepID=UPI003DA2E603
MREIKIFEIPIYSKSYEKYHEQLNRKKYKEIIEPMRKNGSKELDINFAVGKAYGSYKLWEFNQRKGYIIIKLRKNDILFELYICRKSIHAISKTRYILQYEPSLGEHFRIEEFVSNGDIANEIRKRLDELIIEKKLKRFYIDRQLFDLFIDEFDFIKHAKLV